MMYDSQDLNSKPRVPDSKFQDSKIYLEQRFLQSPEWEEFLRAIEKETFRVKRNLFVIETLPMGLRYAYCPRGPVLQAKQRTQKKKHPMQMMIEKARKCGCDWIRIEPNTQEEVREIQNNTSYTKPSPKTFRLAPRDVQPREILVMDISSSEEELLSQMKSKTRYNIRLAEKKGVEVIVSKERQYRDRFFELVRETANRAGIRTHPRDHYEKLLNTLGEDTAKLYIAKYQGEIIAVNLMIFYEDFVIYLHGGSGDVYKNVMAPFLLQWRAIQDAKKEGKRWYDFGGIDLGSRFQVSVNSEDEAKRKNQERAILSQQSTGKSQLPWAGITRFKQGFAPETESVKFPGTYDVVLNVWKYKGYRFLYRAKQLLKR